MPSANKLQEISGMHSRAGLRGTALGAASYHSVDAETTPEGYSRHKRAGAAAGAGPDGATDAKCSLPSLGEALPAQRFPSAMTTLLMDP